jgi:hypothetical protein
MKGVRIKLKGQMADRNTTQAKLARKSAESEPIHCLSIDDRCTLTPD